MEKFKICALDGKQIIEHLQFPRFTAIITFGGLASDLEDIKFIDNPGVDALKLAGLMKEAGEFILNYKK